MPTSMLNERFAQIHGVREAVDSIAALAEESLRLEVSTWPKPGLVSHRDSGSHDDMDAQMFYRCAAAIRPYFRAFVEAGTHTPSMASLRRIGREAERAMLAATHGVNTHRGAIFGMGLLCAAAGMRHAGHVDAAASLGSIVAERWAKDIMAGPRLTDSHGENVKRRFGALGARHEAAMGFPAVYRVGLPALLQAALLCPDDSEAQRVHACFALIASVEDTNLLYRGGEVGLLFAQLSARRFLGRGGVGQASWRESAASIHRQFVARRLSPGGTADLLGLSLFVQYLQRDGWSP
jgi:triphosphoribosyl-dephospho-CoA synthase